MSSHQRGKYEFQDQSYTIDLVCYRRDIFSEAEYWDAYPCCPIGETSFYEATLTARTGQLILRVYGPSPIDAILKMEWLLEEQGQTGPLRFIGKLIDECSPRRSLHHGERCSEQQ